MYGDRYIPMSFYDTVADARKTLQEKSLISLEMQTDLLEWLRTTTSVNAYAHFMKAYGYTKVQNARDRRVLGQWLHGQVKGIAEAAPTYYVSGDMCEMVKLGAQELDVSEGLQPNDLPTNSGFLVFDRPMPIIGPAGLDDEGRMLQGEDVKISAILWEGGEVGQVDPSIVGEDRFSPMERPDMPTAPGVKYYLFAIPHDMAATLNISMKRELEQMLKSRGLDLPEPITQIDKETGLPVEWVTESDVRKQQGPVCIYDFSGWSMGQAWGEVPYGETDGVYEDKRGYDKETGVFLTHPVVNQARRILLATWRMLNQKVVRTETNRAPRHLRHRAARMMPCDGDILIIRLRREYNLRLKLEELGETGDHSELWSHRWIVRGFWRRPPNTAPTHPKSIWVQPHIKGPEHLPLVIKEKIFSLEH